MEDAKRFLRYVIPGLIFFVETSFYIFILIFPTFVSLCTNQKKIILDFIINVNLGIAGIFLLVSGGIGYLFSMFHHELYWKIKAYKKIDHTALLEFANKRDYLKWDICDSELANDSTIPRTSLTGGWRIVNCIWHELRGTSKQIKNVHERTNTLSDIMHGAGATFVGSIFAFIISILIILLIYHFFMFIFSWYFTIFFIISSVGLMFVHYISYKTTVEQCGGVIEIALLDELDRFKRKNGKAYEIIVNKKDIYTRGEN